MSATRLPATVSMTDAVPERPSASSLAAASSAPSRDRPMPSGDSPSPMRSLSRPLAVSITSRALPVCSLAYRVLPSDHH
jgi:hypothetical protein